MASLENPLDAVALTQATTAYPRSSRYYGLGTARFREADGQEVTYLRRRLLPDPEGMADLTTHTVSTGDRPDLLAARYLGNAEQWWQIADANSVLDPRELTGEPGRQIRITLPSGVPGGAHG
ncbi:hypothetical protein AB5J72_08825 [Streptomyces sp. CG1]|uniref:hypothetical protein n=1 Tax=Streptomyces sp. CG1 TaxID=1287523 RepID=UPI0034E2159F